MMGPYTIELVTPENIPTLSKAINIPEEELWESYFDNQEKGYGCYVYLLSPVSERD